MLCPVSMTIFLNIDFIFQGSFWLTAKSSGKYREFPHAAFYTWAQPPRVLSTSHQLQNLFYGLDKCIMTYIHHCKSYGIISLPYECSVLCFPPTKSLIITDLFTVTKVLLFLQWHRVEIIKYAAFPDWLFSLRLKIESSMPFHSLIAHIFLALNNISLCQCTTFIHSSTEGHLGCFQVLIITNKAAITICSMCRFLCRHKFSTPLGKC